MELLVLVRRVTAAGCIRTILIGCPRRLPRRFPRSEILPNRFAYGIFFVFIYKYIVFIHNVLRVVAGQRKTQGIHCIIFALRHFQRDRSQCQKPSSCYIRTVPRLNRSPAKSRIAVCRRFLPSCILPLLRLPFCPPFPMFHVPSRLLFEQPDCLQPYICQSLRAVIPQLHLAADAVSAPHHKAVQRREEHRVGAEHAPVCPRDGALVDLKRIHDPHKRRSLPREILDVEQLESAQVRTAQRCLELELIARRRQLSRRAKVLVSVA